MGDDLAGCPEVECAASIGSAYAGSNPLLAVRRDSKDPAGSLAVVFAAAYLLAAPMGRDLSAQVAHAQLAEQHWPALLNLMRYGGFDPLGYSVLSSPVMALLGVFLLQTFWQAGCEGMIGV